MRNIKKLKPSVILLVLFFVLSSQGHGLAAVSCLVAPDCYVSGTIGSVGIGSFADVSTIDSRFDTARFTSTTGYDLWVISDVRKTVPYKIFEKIYFDGDSANNPQRMDVKFSSSVINGGSFVQDSGESRTLETSQLNLNHVNFRSDPALQFFGTDNRINLIDSRVEFGATPEFISNAPFTINVNDPSGAGTESSFVNFFGNFRPASTTINLENSNTLTIKDSGRLFTSTDAERLYFGSPVTGNVNNATLKIDSSNVYFNSTSFDFTNGGTLELVNPDSKIEFRSVSFDNSLMTLGNNTTVTARDISLDTAYIDLGSGAKINTAGVTVKGAGSTTILGGSGGNFAFINAESFVIDAGATFQQDSSRVTVSRDLVLSPDSTLKVNSDDSVFLASTIVGTVDPLDPAKTSTVDINNRGTFVLVRGLSNIGRKLQFDIDGTSFLRVGKDGILDLGLLPGFNGSGEISVQNEGQIDLDGTLAGYGRIEGSGKFLINEPGQISPGNDIGDKTGTITFENAVEFTSFGTSGNRSRYLAEIDVVGGTATNDLLQYDDQSFDITNLDSIEVNTASAKTADELDRKSFTIISSVDAGSTGTLTTGGSYPAIVEGGDIPALIDFTVFNNSTFGNDDVTLQADKDYDHLAKHPSVTSKNHRSGASLLINAVNSGNAATMSALNSLTNSQVESHLDSFHPEPYSSYMTISLEHSDMIMNTVLNHAARDGVFSTGRSHEATQPGTEKRYWASAGAMDTVSDAVQPTLPETRRRTWMDVSYNEGDVNGDGDLGDFDYNLSSLTVGQDLVASDDRALGIYFSFGTQEMDEHDKANQDFDGDVYHLGMYLNQANVGGWDLRGVLGYAYSDHSSKRRVLLGNSSETTSADYDSHSAYAGVKATVIGYQNDWVTLSPELGFNYIYYTQESFKESGDPALSLKIDSADAHAIIASAGLNSRFASFSDTMSIYPLAFARYEHDFYANANNEHEIDAALVAHPDYKQTFVGQNRGEHALITGLGLGSDLTSALQVNGGFVHSENSHGREWGAGLNLEYLW